MFLCLFPLYTWTHLAPLILILITYFVFFFSGIAKNIQIIITTRNQKNIQKLPLSNKPYPKTASALLKKSKKQEIESAYRGLKLETRSSRNGNCRNVYCWWQVTWAHYPVTWGSDCDLTSSCHESVRLLEISKRHGCWCQVSVVIKLCLR